MGNTNGEVPDCPSSCSYKQFFCFYTAFSFLRTCLTCRCQEGPLPTAAQEGTTLHRTLARDSYGETWTDELEGRPIHNGTLLELLVWGRWVPVLDLRDSHVAVEGPRASLRSRKSNWNTRHSCRVLRQHAHETLQDFWRQQPHQRPRLELLVDLTSLEKTGRFNELADGIHTYHGVRGVHLVVLYLCCGELRLPWAFQVWQGKGTATPAQLALK